MCNTEKVKGKSKVFNGVEKRLLHCTEKGESLRHSISSFKFSPSLVLQGQPTVCMAGCLGHSGTNTPHDNASTPTLASFAEV